MKSTLLGIFGAALVLALVWHYMGIRGQSDAGYESISAANLQQIIMHDSTTFVLDVRTQTEYAGPLGHIAGAHLIPVQELETRIGELKQHKDGEIYVICRSGNRSRKASSILIANEYTPINILGGMRAWHKLAPAIQEEQ